MIKHLLAVQALLVVATAHAGPNESCVTNELDESLITADIAFAVGKCHLALATDEPNGVSALEYAHSWFLEARRLGASHARQGLDEVEHKLKLAAMTKKIKSIETI